MMLAVLFAGGILYGGESSAAKELTSVQQLWVNSFDAEQGGDYDKALEYTALILKDADNYYLPNLRMGWLMYLKKDYKRADRYYRKAAQLSPGAISSLQGIMNCANAVGARERETKMAKAILMLDPMNYNANLRLAELYYEGGNFQVAGSYYRKLLALYPEDFKVANGVAWCYLKEGLTQQAAMIFNNILVVRPNYLQAKSGLELCVAANKRVDRSVKKKKER